MKCLTFFVIHLLWVSLLVSGCKTKDEPKPNILFISIDDLRPELGCYGVDQIKSPNIDKLASSGTVFLNSYCNVPVCGASRASLLTGLRPAGKVRLIGANCRSDESAVGYITLPEYLKDNGYHTVSNGKVMHHQPDSPEAWSEPAWRACTNHEAGIHYYNIYNDWVDPESGNNLKEYKGKVTGPVGPFYESPDVDDNAYHDGQVCDRTIEDLKRLKELDKPFFLACGFWRPHLPFNAPKKYWDLYDREKLFVADNRFKPENAPWIKSSQEMLHQYTANEGFPDDYEFHKLAKHAYYASVIYIDALVGKLIRALEETGLAENTIVVLWGEHGFHLGEHNLWGKHNMMNTSLKAPLVIRYPGKSGQRPEQLVDFIDIYPTLCEFLELPVPEHCEGKSLKPIFSNTEVVHKDALYMNFGSLYSIKTQDYLYTARIKDGEDPKAMMLYNHKNDPQENVNLVSLPEYKSVVEELQTKMLATFFEE